VEKIQHALTCEAGGNNITVMDTPDLELIRDALLPLCGVVQHQIARSMEVSIAHHTDLGLVGSAFSWSRAHLARAHMGSEFRKLSQLGALGSWKVEIGPNTSIMFTDVALSLRLLRPGLEGGGHTPPPGRNLRRRAYYRQDSTELSVLGVAGSALIGVWDYDPETLQASVRVVRPAGVWSAGSDERVDLDFMLPSDRQGLSSLAFEPVDEMGLEDLFSTSEGEGVGGGNAGSGR
jgi:hypothetical protein